MSSLISKLHEPDLLSIVDIGKCSTRNSNLIRTKNRITAIVFKLGSNRNVSSFVIVEIAKSVMVYNLKSTSRSLAASEKKSTRFTSDELCLFLEPTVVS
jgi:hypothetical protein